MQATPGLRRHGGRLLTEPLRGTVEPSTFFTFLAGHRSSLRALRSGLSRHILAALRYSTTRHYSTPGRYRFLSPEGKKNCWWRRNRTS